MNIVFFSHPAFLGSQSMPRFVNMLVKGMKRRGNQVKVFMPKAYLCKIPAPFVIRKWLGYIDQYVVFPLMVQRQLKGCPANTLFVITDHALGPYVAFVANYSHVIHCHDFLAQLSAMDRIPENPTGWSGRQYQRFIRRGYSRGKHFISVSNKTQRDLHAFLGFTPLHSEVVYNGLNPIFKPQDPLRSRVLLSEHTGINLVDGFILHVGGNQWYKNRFGVIQIYNAWRSIQKKCLPLIMIGKKPNSRLMQAFESSPYKTDIHLIVNVGDTLMPTAYSGASAFLFPSIAEGFGWPIAEAMACGCPVVTTNAAPMTEVSGDAGFLIPLQTTKGDEESQWAMQAAVVLDNIINMTPQERAKVVEAGLLNAKRFDVEHALDQIEGIYRKVIGVYSKEKVTGVVM